MLKKPNVPEVTSFLVRFEYGRSGNPTRKVLEECLAALDGAKHAMTFSSGTLSNLFEKARVKGFCFSVSPGLAACSALVHTLNSGDHMISMDDLYGGSNRLFRKVVLPKNNIETTFVDLTDIDKVGGGPV